MPSTVCIYAVVDPKYLSVVKNYFWPSLSYMSNENFYLGSLTCHRQCLKFIYICMYIFFNRSGACIFESFGEFIFILKLAFIVFSHPACGC